MSFVITRTNGNVTQYWEDNEAAWDFFICRMAKDVHWRNVDGGRKWPKRWPDWWAASLQLQTRTKYLKGPEKANEKNWDYHIITEEELDGMDS